MGGFNRNIITTTDIANYVDPDKRNPVTLDAKPPAGVVAPSLQPAGGAPATTTGGQPTVEAGKGDDYLTKLLKYVPLEVLGAYLFVEGVITTNVQDHHDLQVWLGVTLAVTVIVAIIYPMRVLNVVRWSQLSMSAVGIVVYVFATGGWFATTNWYHDWFASIALVVFAMVVAIVPVKPLPLEKK